MMEELLAPQSLPRSRLSKVLKVVNLVEFQLFVMKSIVNSMNLSKITKSSWFVSVEPEEIVEWVDPFDSIFLKLLTVIVYIIEILSSTILLTFVAYETKGYAGHYRTVMNQLLSCGYGAVSDGLFFRVIGKVVYTIRPGQLPPGIN